MRNQRVYRAEVVVLKASDFGEADRALTLFTAHHGKVRAIAKGARRPGSRLGGHVDLLTHANLLLARGRNFEIVTQAETVEPFLGLRDDLWRAGLGYQIAELVDRMTEEGHEDRPLFEALLEALRRIDAEPDPEPAAQLFEVTLLDRLGYRPQLRNCLGCGATLERVDSYYSPSTGGVLCPLCGPRDASARPLSANAFALLRLLQSGDYATLARVRKSEPLRREVGDVLRNQVRFLLERDLKSSAFLSRVRAMVPEPAPVG
jgi:DNA repair protein RecO (recombination protein O)